VNRVRGVMGVSRGVARPRLPYYNRPCFWPRNGERSTREHVAFAYGD